MYRLYLFVLTICSYFLLAITSPVPTNVTIELEKRVTHTGRGTFFYPGLGHCGKRNKNSDHIVAVSNSVYKNGVNCDQWMQIKNVANGKVVYAKMRDSCKSCGPNDVDMSPSTFSAISPLSAGVVRVTWHFMNREWHP